MSIIFSVGKKSGIGSTAYKILLGTITSKKKNRWSVYEFYQSKKSSPEWRIRRDKDGLVLSGYSLGEVSLSDYNKKKDKIQKMINDKEK
jgi:hypothetical protein